MTNVNGDKVSYTYDEYGNKISMTYPDGRVVSYEYDSMNCMTSVTGLDGTVTRYAYDAGGPTHRNLVEHLDNFIQL